jgi:hypothetical protein
VLDPITIGLAIKAMQGAFHGIQYCCEALADGKVQVQKIKKAAEDAQTIVKEVKSVWSILGSIFSGKKEPEPSPAQAAPNAKPAVKQKDVYIKHIPTEAEIVQKFVDHIGDFYHHHRELSEVYDTKSQEVYSMDRPDPRDILLLSQIKNELDGSYMKLSGMMRGANVPPQLGPLWSNFNKIYETATEQQQARRERERIRKSNESWRRQEAYNDKVDLGVALLITLMFVVELWAIWINLFIVE